MENESLLHGEEEAGFQIPFNRSFTAKMCQSSDEVKAYYRIIKNHVLSYKKAHSRISWAYEAIHVGKHQVLKLSVKGKTLCLYLALDPENVDKKFKVEKAKTTKFADVPCLYRISAPRRCNYAKSLIDLLMKQFGAEKGPERDEEYDFPYQDTKTLIEKGLIKQR